MNACKDCTKRHAGCHANCDGYQPKNYNESPYRYVCAEYSIDRLTRWKRTKLRDRAAKIK